jgi:hypothetical protein
MRFSRRLHPMHANWASCGFLLLSLLMLFEIACGGSSSARQPMSYVSA